MALSRRAILTGSGTAIVAVIATFAFARTRQAKPKKSFSYTLSDSEWRKKLSPAAYGVLRKSDTERAFSSPLDKEKRKGTFACKGCGQQLFRSADKFDSGTGWPSFTRSLAKATGTSTDYNLGYPRTEVHCSRCGGHLGHMFNDGPKPTGQRWCMNGVAMTFMAG